MTRKLGEEYELLNVGFKRYSCCGSNFTSLEALSQIMKEENLQAQEIRKIKIRTTNITKLHVGWDYKPEGMTAAQMNLSYCLAAMALEGEVFVDQFTEEKTRDPKILEFIKRIEVVPDPDLDCLGQEYRHAIICGLETEDGRSFEKRVDFSIGGPDKPMGRQKIEEKFKRLVRKVFPDKKTEGLLRTIQHIEEVSPLTELTRQLR
jgi:2-methylcitrate dehydratase PrpD